jgi:dihydroneopterin aldolase
MDTIELSGFRFDAIVGVLDSEQRRPQPLEVNLQLGLDLGASASSGDLSETVDYAAVQAAFMTLAQQGRWRLIESLAMAACRLLLLPPGPGESRAAIQRVTVSVRKPAILVDATPGVQLTRTVDQLTFKDWAHDSGVRVTVLEATLVQGAWRVTMEPGTAWDVPPTWSLHVLGGVGEIAGRSVGPGDVIGRAPARRATAAEPGMTLLAVGGPDR